MNIFSARLDIGIASAVSSTRWNLAANIVDVTGFWQARDVSVGDIIYANGMDGSGNVTVCRYLVASIISANGAVLQAQIDWGEPNTNYADPQIGYDAVIGRALPGGVTSLPSASQGVGLDILQSARNIDLNLATYSSGTGSINMTPTTLTSSAGVITLPSTGSPSHFYIVNGAEDVTRITGWTSGMVTIRWATARTMVHTDSVLELNYGQSRLLGQGEICTFVFQGSICREMCAPGGMTPLDGGSF